MNSPKQIEILRNSEINKTLYDSIREFAEKKNNIKIAASIFLVVLFTAITILSILFWGSWAVALLGPLIAVASGAA